MSNFENEEEAREFGERLRKRMLTPDAWEVHVHENLGWHCCLHQKDGVVSLRFRNYGGKTKDDIRYSCLISDEPGKYTGCYVWHSNENDRVSRIFRDPNDAVEIAVRAMVQLAGERIAQLQEATAVAAELLVDP